MFKLTEVEESGAYLIESNNKRVYFTMNTTSEEVGYVCFLDDDIYVCFSDNDIKNHKTYEEYDIFLLKYDFMKKIVEKIKNRELKSKCYQCGFERNCTKKEDKTILEEIVKKFGEEHNGI